VTRYSRILGDTILSDISVGVELNQLSKPLIRPIRMTVTTGDTAQGEDGVQVSLDITIMTLGMHVAEKSLFINIARIMWAFDIQKPAGVDFKAYLPEEGGFNIPKRGHVVIRPRSESHANVLRREWDASKKEGLHYKPAPREVFSKVKL
jgi:hypothetical protein